MIDTFFSRLKRILNSQSGFTIAETLFAGVVMMGAIVTVIAMLDASVTTLALTNGQSVAGQIANEQLEKARNFDYEQLASKGPWPSDDPDLASGTPATYRDVADDGTSVYRTVNYDADIGIEMWKEVRRRKGKFWVYTYVLWVDDAGNPQAFKRVIVKVKGVDGTHGETILSSTFAKEDGKEPRPSVSIRGVESSNFNYFSGTTQNMLLGAEDSIRGSSPKLLVTARNNSGKSTGIAKVEARLYSPTGQLKTLKTIVGPGDAGSYTFTFDVSNSLTYPDSEGYVFIVDSYDSLGGSQRDSMRVTIDNTVPAAVATLNASGVPGSSMQNAVDWVWNPAAGDGVPKISRFILQRKLKFGGSGTFSQVAALPADQRIFVDSGLEPDTAYIYRMVAVDGAGNLAFSNEKERSFTFKSRADFLAPSIPTSTTAAAAAWNAVDVSWAASIDEVGGTGLSGYYLVAGDGTGTTVVGYTGPTGFTPELYRDYGLKGSASYTYYIKAYDLEGNISGASTGSQVTTPLR